MRIHEKREEAEKEQAGFLTEAETLSVSIMLIARFVDPARTLMTRQQLRQQQNNR